MGFDNDVIIKNWIGKYVLLKKNWYIWNKISIVVFGLGFLLISLIFKSVCWLMNEKLIKMVLIENVVDVLFMILYYLVWCCIYIVYRLVNFIKIMVLKDKYWCFDYDFCWIFYKDNLYSVGWFIY